MCNEEDIEKSKINYNIDYSLNEGNEEKLAAFRILV